MSSFIFIESLPNFYPVSSSPFYLYNCNISPDWAFRDHISRALPTEIIFYLLELIPSKSFMKVYSKESMLYTLGIIIKWPQVSVIEGFVNCSVVDKPLKLKIYLVSSRDLVPKDRATCIIASRPNFFITNPSLSGLINHQVGFVS